jgi:hypothetical protein
LTDLQRFSSLSQHRSHIAAVLFFESHSEDYDALIILAVALHPWLGCSAAAFCGGYGH